MAREEAKSGTATSNDYDVFLSFRGPDTRNTFADFLYVFMENRGIRAFRDEEELPPGEKISEISRAVESSQIYIPILSKNYASSRWCLRELKYMVDGHGKHPSKRILPIFYDVDPEDVKLETELYKSALTKHEEDPGCTEVKPWEEALTVVARIKGWHIKDQRQGKVIEDIVKEVLQEINTTKRDLPAHLVGIDDRVEDIKRLLNCDDTSEVRSVVIYGIGGMGKTTLAKAIFTELYPQFDNRSFLLDIQEHSLVKLQKKLLADLFHFLLLETFDSEEGNNVIRRMLPNKRVLLVFDDMDENDQSTQLAKYCTLCGPGSRIIITTRNKSVFSMIKPEGFDETISTSSTEIIPYEMKEMRLDHALQLFNELAFSTDSAPPDLYDLSKEVVELTGGLPLALEVMGSQFRNQDRAKWISIVKKLKDMPCTEVFQRLKISYDTLDDCAQQIYLDIACFFNNKKKTLPMYMWEACGYHPEVTIDVLINKSLIKIVDRDIICMHNLLRDVGREIVRRETADRSRSWCLETAHEKGIENAVGLTPRRKGDNFTRKYFADLTKARFLKLDGGNFAGNFEDILPKLRWLCWENCPPEPHAKNFLLNRLVILKLSGNIIIDKWSGWVEIMEAGKLKVLKIAGSRSLMKTPRFSEFITLERLVLKDFLRLEEIDPSIGVLQQLNYLKIKWCPRLRELPKEIGCLTDLKELILIQGHSVCYLPDSIGNIRGLSRLVMEDTGLVEIPGTIKGLVDLKHLCLVNCTNLNSLSDAIGELKSLTELDLSGTTIGNLPRFIWNLENSTLRMNSLAIRTQLMRDSPMRDHSVRHLPDLIGNLRGLPSLSMEDTGSVEFQEIVDGLEDPESLPSLNYTSLNSLSEVGGELRTSTASYLSGTANGELPPFRDDNEELRPGERRRDEEVYSRTVYSFDEVLLVLKRSTKYCNFLKLLRMFHLSWQGERRWIAAAHSASLQFKPKRGWRAAGHFRSFQFKLKCGWRAAAHSPSAAGHSPSFQFKLKRGWRTGHSLSYVFSLLFACSLFLLHPLSALYPSQRRPFSLHSTASSQRCILSAHFFLNRALSHRPISLASLRPPTRDRKAIPLV